MPVSSLTRAVLAATVFIATSPAGAASSTGSGRAVLLDPVAFTNVDDLDFGLVVSPSSGNGTVTINPVDGSATYSNLVGLASVATRRGRLVGSADIGQDVEVTALLPTKLYQNGDSTKPFVAVALGLDHLPSGTGKYYYTTNSARVFNIYVGGTLTVPAGTANGSYNNLFKVTANYL